MSTPAVKPAHWTPQYSLASVDQIIARKLCVASKLSDCADASTDPQQRFQTIPSRLGKFANRMFGEFFYEIG